MKLIVSSTAMMSPIFQSERRQHNAPPPHRVLGLLEHPKLNVPHSHPLEKIVQYHRPDHSHVLLQSANWQDYIQLQSRQSASCIAVFGYEFDGSHCWYQLWNSNTERACWVVHNDDMNYKPFAILAMDALVSLLPNWDGVLHPSPKLSIDNNQTQTDHNPRLDSDATHDLLVSDASTSTAGLLWFLVTVNTVCNVTTHAIPTLPTRTGWIAA